MNSSTVAGTIGLVSSLLFLREMNVRPIRCNSRSFINVLPMTKNESNKSLHEQDLRFAIEEAVVSLRSFSFITHCHQEEVRQRPQLDILFPDRVALIKVIKRTKQNNKHEQQLQTKR
mmetsp:Transcript_43038/g.104114  ORF Transcript_43038/g.104114 Transcript_43038/m.104114 type:complete len:117 (-) Transcript_43038:1684-2034(-)